MQINTEHFLTFTQTNMASQWLSVFWDFSQNSQFVQKFLIAQKSRVFSRIGLLNAFSFLWVLQFSKLHANIDM